MTPKSASDSGWRHQMTSALLEVPVALSANLGCAEMTVRQLLALKEGDYLRLDREPDGRLDMFVENQPIFEVEPTVNHGNVAVTLLDRIATDTPNQEEDEVTATTESAAS